MKRLHRYFRIELVAWALTAALVGCTDDVQPSTTSPVANFEALWKLLDEHYCYFDLRAEEYGLDWQEVHGRYASLVNDTMPSRRLYDVLSLMIDELRDGHTNLITPFATSSNTAWMADRPHNFSSDLLMRVLGDGWYHTGSVWYDILPDSIAYVYISSFSSSIPQRLMDELFHYFEDCRGLIIDVRDNGGGNLDVEQSLAARFMSEETRVGYMTHKNGPAHDAFSTPMPITIVPDTTLTRWTAPVCVLTNRRCYSATNDFVRSMKLLPQVTVVGDRTGGGAGLPMSTELPNGWSVRYSSSPMFDVEMHHTEFGIDPDVWVDLDADDAERGIDSIIAAACRLLRGTGGEEVPQEGK